MVSSFIPIKPSCHCPEELMFGKYSPRHFWIYKLVQRASDVSEKAKPENVNTPETLIDLVTWKPFPSVNWNNEAGPHPFSLIRASAA